MKRVLLILMLAGFAFFNATPLGAITMYDDFRTNYIKKSMWLDHFNGKTHLHERVREIDPTDGVLVLKLGSNEQLLPSRIGVSMASPVANPLTAIRSDIRVIEMNNDPTDSATVFARVGGIFYNRTFANPESGCFQGDVWAELNIGDRGNGLESWFEIEVFDTCNNDTAVEVASDSLTSGVTLEKDHFYTLEISYNEDARLTFNILDNGTHIGASPISVDGPDRMGPPHGPFGNLQACVHDASGEYVDGYIHAEFDNAYVNGSLYDTFDTAPINSSLWNGREYARESVNGHARLQAKGRDNGITSRLFLRDRFTPYLEAKAQMKDTTKISQDGVGRVRIGGIFYNQQFGPGNHNGNQGDVFVSVSLELKGPNTRVARWRLEVFTSTDHSAHETIDQGLFKSAFDFNTDYVLSINFTGTEFIFGYGNESVTYTIDTPVNDPYEPFRFIESRLWLDPGERGTIIGHFDDVRVSDPDYTNLSGEWQGTISNSRITKNTGDCDPDPDDDINVTLKQNGCEVNFHEENDGVVGFGVISGSRVLVQDSGPDGDGFYDSIADMTLSDAKNMTGTLFTWGTPSGCEEEGDLTLTQSNAAPSADDQSVTVAKDAKDHPITLTGSDAESDPLTFAVASQPANGTLSGTAPDLLYTPKAGYQGSDSFTFSVDDGRGGSSTGTVTITVSGDSTSDDGKSSSGGGGGGGGGGCFIQHLF